MTSARQLAGVLRRSAARIVFAESCTAGLAAAQLGAIAGISDFLCASAVTYRDQAKIEWLGVDAGLIAANSSVCAPVAGQMALGALRHTPEAHLAVSITGHLGPNAPAALDGRVFVGIACRGEAGLQVERVVERQLVATTRAARRREAVAMMYDETAAAVHRRFTR